MEKMAFQCSGHRWMPAAGPGFQPGPHVCASGVAPTSSFTPRGLQGKWCPCPRPYVAKSQPGFMKEKSTW